VHQGWRMFRQHLSVLKSYMLILEALGCLFSIFLWKNLDVYAYENAASTMNFDIFFECTATYRHVTKELEFFPFMRLSHRLGAHEVVLTVYAVDVQQANNQAVGIRRYRMPARGVPGI
jgi:hypothetical protein